MTTTIYRHRHSNVDPDMILVGGTGLSTAQWKMQMSMWSIFAAPLLMSNDLPNISQEAKTILLNQEVSFAFQC